MKEWQQKEQIKNKDILLSKKNAKNKNHDIFVRIKSFYPIKELDIVNEHNLRVIKIIDKIRINSFADVRRLIDQCYYVIGCCPSNGYGYNFINKCLDKSICHYHETELYQRLYIRKNGIYDRLYQYSDMVLLEAVVDENISDNEDKNPMAVSHVLQGKKNKKRLLKSTRRVGDGKSHMLLKSENKVNNRKSTNLSMNIYENNNGENKKFNNKLVMQIGEVEVNEKEKIIKHKKTMNRNIRYMDKDEDDNNDVEKISRCRYLSKSNFQDFTKQVQKERNIYN